MSERQATGEGGVKLEQQYVGIVLKGSVTHQQQPGIGVLQATCLEALLRHLGEGEILGILAACRGVGRLGAFDLHPVVDLCLDQESVCAKTGERRGEGKDW